MKATDPLDPTSIVAKVAGQLDDLGVPSDRQWADVLGVLQVQGPSLDDAYLDRWAAALGVEDLLLRARAG